MISTLLALFKTVNATEYAQPDSLLPLCCVKPGERARIVHIEEGQRFRKRLADLGLAVGMEVRVVQASHHSGPMILAVRTDTRLAIGWGMARKIVVKRAL